MIDINIADYYIPETNNIKIFIYIDELLISIYG